MQRPPTIRFLIVVALALGLSGCQAWRSATALSYSNDDLLFLDRDGRVRYEAGAALLAEKVAEVLEKAVLTVEAAQHRSFSADIRIFVFSTRESFSSRSGALPIARGNTFNGAVYLSPRLLEQPETIENIVTHELSHLHLQQQMGLAAAARLPAWFHEGLAVSVSGGGGAEQVSAHAALGAIGEGRSIRPGSSQNSLFPNTANAFGLEPHMFYRQSELLVSRMRSASPARFQALMATLYSGKLFEASFLLTYEQSVEDYWSAFVSVVRANPSLHTDARR